MRRVRYTVATSLDGYISGPDGEADWIIRDPGIDFREMFAQFDTFLMGRRTFERARSRLPIPNSEIYVFSRTLRQKDCPEATIVAENGIEIVKSLRRKKGKDIWLFGGGELFRSLLDASLVDTVELGVFRFFSGKEFPCFLVQPRGQI